MKKTALCLMILFIWISLPPNQVQFNKNRPSLKGPYLGQKPPKMDPVPFVLNFLDESTYQGSTGFALKGTVFLFQVFIKRDCHTYIMRLEGGTWTAPQRIPFWKSMIHNGDFVFSYDDKTLLYQVKTQAGTGLVSNIWRVEVLPKGWSKPTSLPSPINTPYDESFASEARNKNLYFFSRRPGGRGKSDLYMCAFRDGKYQRPVNLASLNTQYHEWDPFIAPDESYLIFCSTKPTGRGADDLYITFKGNNGKWSTPVNMGEKINSPRSENRPYVTNDGKYFFYTSSRNRTRRNYWVSIKYIYQFRNGNQ